MARPAHRAAIFATLVLLAFAIAACGDSEADQRKAFIEFLQKKIVDRPGVHIPKPSDEETKSFGPYSQHYAIIIDFTSDSALTAMSTKLSNGLPNLTSIQSVIDNRDTIRNVGVEMGDMLRAMDVKYTSTIAARDALTQPDDLRAVYDKAFDKTITGPVNGFHETVPIAQNISVAAANIGDYAAGHRDTLQISGGQLQAKNAKVQAEIMALVGTLSALGSKFNEAQRKLRVTLSGG